MGLAPDKVRIEPAADAFGPALRLNSTGFGIKDTRTMDQGCSVDVEAQGHIKRLKLLSRNRHKIERVLCTITRQQNILLCRDLTCGQN